MSGGRMPLTRPPVVPAPPLVTVSAGRLGGGRAGDVRGGGPGASGGRMPLRRPPAIPAPPLVTAPRTAIDQAS